MALITGKDAPRYSQNTVDQFIGNGSTTSFALSRTPPTVSSIFVTIDGVKQHVTTYSIVGSNIVFSEAPPSTSSVEVVHIGSLGPIISPSDNSVTTEKIVDGAVTAAKISNGNITKEKLDFASGTGTGAVLLPSGTTAQRPTGAPGLMRHNSQTGYIEFWDKNLSTWVGIGEFSATGGTVVVSNGYTYHKFTSSGTFQVISGSKNVEYLIVGGGGGAGTSNGAAGGGAGGLLNGSFTATVGTYSAVVGAGGANSNGNREVRASNGGTSSIFSLNALGGGGSGSEHSSSSPDVKGGASGGSGGGGVRGFGGGSGTAGQGNAGGSNVNDGSPYYSGGGGGGAGAAGTNGSASTMGNGGIGRLFADWASATGTGDSGYYAGGGAAGAYYQTAPGVGGSRGLGGGGPGGSDKSVGTLSGYTNTGGGGGGHGNYTVASGNGGSGIIIIRYAN